MSIGIVEAVVIGLLGLGLLLGLVRLWRGPYAPDRIVAADTLSVIATAGIVLLALLLDSPLYLDVALARAIESGDQVADDQGAGQ